MKLCESVEQPKPSARPNFPITLNQLFINGEWREQGWEALEFYLQTKTVWVDLS